jgi:hypothetical protein
LAHHSKKKKKGNYGGSPKNMEFLLPLWLTYTGERKTILAKAHEIKVRCYGELFGGTCEELGNSLLGPPSPPKKKSFIFHFSAQ